MAYKTLISGMLILIKSNLLTPNKG